MINIDPLKTIISGGFYAGASTVTAAISSLCGHSIGLLKGAGFGFVQGVVAEIALSNMPKFLPKESHSAVALIGGGIVSYGAFHAAAAMGFIAFPITLPSAAILTIVNVAIPYLAPAVFGSKTKALAPSEGAAAGAATGAAVGVVAGGGPGAVLGAVAGAVTGAAVGQ